MDDFELKKLNWLEEVTNHCHEFALESDLDFYVFQTPLFYNPNLLIIGINPGGGKPYTQMLNEKRIKKRTPESLFYEENTLLVKPKWEIDCKEKGNDVLRDRFKRIFNEKNNLNILENAMMMNMFYFNTIKEKDINNSHSQIRKFCIEKTKEFIEISNPKNILFLTSSNGNLKDCSVEDIKILGNNIKEGKLGGRTVYAIPHYGYVAAYSHFNAEKTGKALSKLFVK